jgi:hypothetical protein
VEHVYWENGIVLDEWLLMQISQLKVPGEKLAESAISINIGLVEIGWIGIKFFLAVYTWL